MADKTVDITVKIVVVGNAYAGKTSIIKRYCYGEMSKNYRATIGTDFATSTLVVKNKIVRIQFWDIAGQERFGTMTNHYYRDAHGALIVFDLTEDSSFKGVVKWKDDMERKMQPNNNVPTLLLANKCDLVKQNKSALAVLPTQVDEIVNQYKLLGWKETSAFTQENIPESIEYLVEKILEQPGLFEENESKSAFRVVRKDAKRTTVIEEEEYQCCS